MAYRAISVCIMLIAMLIGKHAVASEIELVGVLGQKAVIVVDGERYVLALGEKTPQGISLVAVQATSVILVVEGVPKTFALGQSGSLSTTFAAPTEAEVRLMPDPMGMFFAHGSINGKPVKFLVDTGATTIALGSDDARRLGIDFKRVGRPVRVDTASGHARGYIIKLDRVRVGDIELFAVDAAVIEGRGPETALLGMSFLNRIEMVRDGGLLKLRKR